MSSIVRARISVSCGAVTDSAFSRRETVTLEMPRAAAYAFPDTPKRSEEHTSELQSLMRISYAVFCLKKKTKKRKTVYTTTNIKTRTHKECIIKTQKSKRNK